MTDDPTWLARATQEAARADTNARGYLWGHLTDVAQQHMIAYYSTPIRAALPVIEAGLREQIACEIEAHQRGSALRVGDVWEQGRDAASRIARGES